jgi:hypothetical protein
VCQLWPAILLTLSSAITQSGVAQSQSSSEPPDHQAALATNQSSIAQPAPRPSSSGIGQAQNGAPVLDKALQDQLYNKENELGRAERDRDAAFFQQNLAPDFLYVAFNGLVLAKDQLVDALQHIQISSYEIRNVKFRRLGPDVMQLAYDLMMQGDAAGVPIPHQLYATSIWVRSSNDWRLIYHQTTPARHH